MTGKWKAALAVVLAAIVTAIAATLGLKCLPAEQATAKAVELRLSMRQAWTNHAWYTREYYTAAVHGNPGRDAAAARLLKNQEEIGAVLGTFYGAPAQTQATTLLKEHIIIATEVVAAAKAADPDKLAEANQRWHQNTAAIAAFLNKANPQHFGYDQTLKLLNDHLALLTAAVTSYLAANYTQATADNDAYVTEILMMADYFTHGIVAQFPDKFRP